jgi:16S rRNA (guanine527-N7)-methyltransferase
VSDRSLSELWKRHFWDSAQLAPLISTGAKTLVDLGSGAGFPGLVLATMLSDRLQVTLVESVRKKVDFLREVISRLGLSTQVRAARIEDYRGAPFDVVTARACAPLPVLLGYAQLFTGSGSVSLLLKGQNVEVELTEARKSWRMTLQRHQSLSDPSGTIREVRELANVQLHATRRR